MTRKQITKASKVLARIHEVDLVYLYARESSEDGWCVIGKIGGSQLAIKSFTRDLRAFLKGELTLKSVKAATCTTTCSVVMYNKLFSNAVVKAALEKAKFCESDLIYYKHQK